MRQIRLVACSVLLVLSLTSGQVLEKTILLPDTFCGPLPECLAYDSLSNIVYVGGLYGSRVIAIDGTTDQKVAWVPVGERVVAMCLNAQNHKLYCADFGDSCVTVVDCNANRVTATVSVGRGPMALCYNPYENKVYCANWSNASVTVIDGTV
ncbi:MAG: hypothetical protein NTX53_01830, partial [candidate division WOR-3 bacterium]|nr:hypothetical protein [candidate division WOR-3 bacterium]